MLVYYVWNSAVNSPAHPMRIVRSESLFWVGSFYWIDRVWAAFPNTIFSLNKRLKMLLGKAALKDLFTTRETNLSLRGVHECKMRHYSFMSCNRPIELNSKLNCDTWHYSKHQKPKPYDFIGLFQNMYVMPGTSINWLSESILWSELFERTDSWKWVLHVIVTWGRFGGAFQLGQSDHWNLQLPRWG